MTAGEDQFESFVGECRRAHLVASRLVLLEQRSLRHKPALSTEAIERSIAGGRHQPRPGVGRNAVLRPSGRSDGERLLGGLLGEVEVAEEADEGGDDASPLLPEDLVERRYHSMIGRTSIAPPRRAAGIRAANPTAASRSSASSMR